MSAVFAAALALAAAPAVDCRGDADKPAVLRCYEAKDHAATVAAARAELRRDGATPGERNFAAGLADAALHELYTGDKDPAHLCELEALLAEYIAATPGAVAKASARREEVAGELRKNHPTHRCDGETSPASGTSSSQESTSPPPGSAPSSTTPPPSTPPPPSSASPRRTLEERPAQPRRHPQRPARARRKLPLLASVGTGALVVAAGLGGGAAGLAFVHDDIRDRARALRREFESNGGQWTPAIEQEREHLLVVDRRAYGAMVACAVGSGVFTALGVALVAAGVRDRGRTEVAPYGGAQGAGLTLRLRF